MRNRKQHRRGGFTLVEVLIVVVILGILAATVLPQFQESTQDANRAATIRNVQTIQSQIQLFRFQHNGVFPGNGGNVFADQMTQRTLPDGKVDNTNGTLGPYIMGEFPANPFDGDNTITATTQDEKGGWFYNPATGEFGPNHKGAPTM